MGWDIHTPGRIGVDAVLEALELVHGHVMDHVLGLHLGHLSLMVQAAQPMGLKNLSGEARDGTFCWA